MQDVNEDHNVAAILSETIVVRFKKLSSLFAAKALQSLF